MLRFSSFLVLLSVSASAVAQSDCGWNPDYNNDNTIGVADLLGLLGVFEEQDSDDDGIFDSQDDCVGVYDPCGVCNGDGVDADLDGVCDDVDDCVGAYDACGVCNGPGPDWPVVESIEQFFDSVYIDQIDLWYVFQTGADTTFTYVCATPGCTDAAAGNFNPDAVIDDGSCTYGPEECGGVSTVTYDGYTYDLVAIGEQCWFAENLRNTHYANGDAIPGELTDGEWSSTTAGAQAVFGDDAANLTTYGRLYNWYAVDDARGLCPSGWHLPTDLEYMFLELELGMSSSELNNIGLRGTDQGAQMKASPSDSPNWNGSNSSGFTALPGGYRHSNGIFSNVGLIAYYWSSFSSGSNAWFRGLNTSNELVARSNTEKRNGFSIRCVLDCENIIGDVICETNEVSGCTDIAATNFDATATSDDGSCSYPFECGDPLSYHDYDYNTVAIGGQCWFAENLRSESYTNGDHISSGLTGSEWSSTTSGAQTLYNNNGSNLTLFGRLYNWFAVEDARGLCPNDWHIPTDADFTVLTEFLGGTSSAGDQLKSSSDDSPSWDGNNNSGFSALPGGFRASGGSFGNLESNAYFWSSSPNNAVAWYRELSSSSNYVGRYTINLRLGFSVRCVHD